VIHPRIVIAALMMSALIAAAGIAQWRRGAGRFQAMPDRSEFPMWDVDSDFSRDAFTFARVRYTSVFGGRGNRWTNDFPDSDWNFSYRLQQLTTLEVDPNGTVLELTDPEIFQFPFLYMNGVGFLEFNQREADALRRHLLSGGFLMVDDFWGEEEWRSVLSQMKKVFTDRDPVELPLSHDIFHFVYDLAEKPQVPDIRTWRSGYRFEYRHGNTGGDEAPHFHAFMDDRGYVVALLCHNNDLGDGWEREGENSDYFHEFSERQSYPMGINIVMYAMTH
jgi:hypothetical protein